MPSGALHYIFTWKAEWGEPTKVVENSEYCIYSKESGEKTGYIHYQGYCKLKQKRTLAWLKKNIHAQAHWEVKRGTVQQAIDYCSKQDTHLEGPFIHGTQPIEERTRTDLQAVVEDIQKGTTYNEIAEQHPTTFIRNYRGIREYINCTAKAPTGKPIVWCLWGDSNVGKSYLGRAFGTYYTVPVDADKPWFNDYDGEDVLMIDEYEGQWSLSFIKQLLEDRNCRLPTKGGYTKNRSKYIVLTSNKNPLHWYENCKRVDLIALFRRFDFCFCIRGSSFNNCTYYKFGLDTPASAEWVYV